MKFSALFLAAAAGSTAYAAPAGSPALTIESAIQRAFERNPDVLKAREALIQSDETYSLYKSKLFPSISGTVEATKQKAAAASPSSTYGTDAYNSYLASLNGSQPLFNWGVFAGIRYAKKDPSIKKRGVEISERALSESVVEAFYSIILNEELLRILQNSLKVQKESLATSERYLTIGKIQKIDVLQQRTQVALLSPKIAQVDSQVKNSAASLAGLLRDLDANNIRLKGSLSAPDHDWVKKVSKEHRNELPEVQQIREQISQFEDNRDVQMAAYWPSLSLSGKLQRASYAKSDLFDSNSTSWSATLQFSVPLFAGLGSYYQRAALASQVKQLELDEVRITDAAYINQIQTERALEVAKTQLDSSRQAAIYGREVVKEAQRSFRLQTINYLQYQSANQAYLDSESSFAQAKYNYIVAASKYFNALGVPSNLLVAKLEELGRIEPLQQE